jgi:hypothetical protein
MATRAAAPSRVMFVLTDVSSMNASLRVQAGRCSRQIAHAWATPADLALPREAAFLCRIQAVQCTPDRTMAGRNAMVGQQPSPQLGNFWIGIGCHTGSERVFMRGQPRHHVASLLMLGGLLGLPAASQHLVDVRHADLEQRSRLVGPRPAVHRSYDPRSQILRVGPTTPNPLLLRLIPEAHESHRKPILRFRSA